MIMLASVLLTTAACKRQEDQGAVYYLNFKPEQDGDWQALADKYTQETGVEVVVLTAAANTYETTLKSEMAKRDAPTLFQVNGPVGLASWKDYCYDLKDTAIYKNLQSDDFALIEGDSVYGIAYAIETYGIIYNRSLLNRYFTMDGAVAQSIEDIDGFDSLKALVEDIQARKDELGIDGAFTSSGMDSSSDWRFKTHLANMPLYYEFESSGTSDYSSVRGDYLDNYRAIWDLYINNATCDPTEISGKTGDDASAEFKNARAVFYQNGTWAYGDISDVGDENLGMLPIYIGAPNEEQQGLCTGSENYWCVNKNANQEDIDATLDFLEWVITSDEGRSSMANDMAFVTPFETFTEEYQADNPLIRAANEYIAAGKTSVKWMFPTMPSEEWKNALGSALTAYAAGTGSWDDVRTAFVDGWASEYEKANANR
ncbi:MAG: ABC transporter substrate-binding protein [Clostridia bacterium]|nr:ABC transporter substrate-binding protein [Clostridia bacterium]